MHNNNKDDSNPLEFFLGGMLKDNTKNNQIHHFKTRLLIRTYAWVFMIVSATISAYALFLIFEGSRRGVFYLAASILLVVSIKFIRHALRTGLKISDNNYTHRSYKTGAVVELKPQNIHSFAFKEDDRGFGVLSFYSQEKQLLDQVFEKHVDRFEVLASWAEQNWPRFESFN